MLYFSLPQIYCSFEKFLSMAVLHVQRASMQFREKENESRKALH